LLFFDVGGSMDWHVRQRVHPLTLDGIDAAMRVLSR